MSLWLTLNLLNFLNRIIHLLFLKLFIIVFFIKMWKLVSQQYRAWSDCMDVQTDLTLHWWQGLTTCGSSRVRVKNGTFFISFSLFPFIYCDWLLFKLRYYNVSGSTVICTNVSDDSLNWCHLLCTSTDLFDPSILLFYSSECLNIT